MKVGVTGGINRGIVRGPVHVEKMEVVVVGKGKCNMITEPREDGWGSFDSGFRVASPTRVDGKEGATRGSIVTSLGKCCGARDSTEVEGIVMEDRLELR